jgi:hypothetical protein
VPGVYDLGRVGVLVLLDLPRDLGLLSAPLGCLVIEQRLIERAVELIDVHGLDALLEPQALTLQPGHSGFVLRLVVGCAAHERLLDPLEHLVAEGDLGDQFGEFGLQRLLARVREGADNTSALLEEGDAESDPLQGLVAAASRDDD